VNRLSRSSISFATIFRYGSPLSVLECGQSSGVSVIHEKLKDVGIGYQ
jgi:hypothetical protein